MDLTLQNGKEIMIYNAFPNFSAFGGAELIVINITKGFAEKGVPSTILSCSETKDYNEGYEITDLTIKKLSLSFIARISKNSIIISHHRKITSIILLLKICLMKRFRIIHVAHNEFYSLKYFTLFPKSVVAVSRKVKQNLIDYFDVDASRITVIYNGIPDRNPEGRILTRHDDNIRILLPARITDVKQQILIVNALHGKLKKNIEIHFAGAGEDLEKLKKLTKSKFQFTVLGFQPLDSIINNYDYVMLFSKVEGLPTVFLEAFMYGKPIISNNAGGSLEILNDMVNGFFASDLNELAAVINSLPDSNSKSYLELCRNARKKYEENYTRDKMTAAYLNLINHEV
jgi:glycosyltransferase involved in cell wall biosynthesis